MQASNPLQVRTISQNIALKDEDWPQAYDVMMKAARAKYRQNSTPVKYLAKTGKSKILYCDPDEQFWGIGLSKFDKGCYDASKWRGSNFFGQGPYAEFKLEPPVHRERAVPCDGG